MGIKIKNDDKKNVAASPYLLPIQYETIAGVLLAETKALEILAESALPAEDRSADDVGFDEAVSEVLYEMEQRARVLTSRLANFRSALAGRPKASLTEDTGDAEETPNGGEG